MRFDLRVKNWQSYIPIVEVANRYRREDFSHDLIAGLVVGVISVPQAVAYAFLAGLPAQAGLYACLAPMVIYAFLGSSRHLVVGPVAIAALMVAATIARHAPEYGDAYLGITTVLCLQAGIFLWLLRLSQMGGLVNLLSHPVITGFVNAAAILIIISQLSALTGISSSGEADALTNLMALSRDFLNFNPATLVIGIACLLGLWLIPRYSLSLLKLINVNVPADHPLSRIGPMLVASLATAIVALWNLDDQFQVAVVGFVPSGLPSFTLSARRSRAPILWPAAFPVPASTIRLGAGRR